MRTEAVAAWINERHAIYMRKEIIQEREATGNWELSAAGEAAWGDPDPMAWRLDYLTNDPILAQYRFCNVYRELDRVTRWIHERIRVPYADHELLWLMLAIARTINWPPTLKNLMYAGAWPDAPGWWPPVLGEWLQKFKNRGDKVYTGAYMIRAESDPKAAWYSWSKQRYIAEVVIGKLWEDREQLGAETSAGWWEALQQYTGWGPFMAYQVVVDLQHTRYLRDAPDNQTWAAAGPGTMRGLNRWRNRDPKTPMNQDVALDQLCMLRGELHRPGVLESYVPTPIDLSDVCNVCCEFDKYERVRLGEGRPRAKYVPGRGY